MGSQVAVINESTLISDADLGKIVAACQTQVGRDFAPIWGRFAKLTLIPRGQLPPADQWWLAIMDTSDQDGALGYHETTDQGKPLGKVFVKDDLDSGSSVSVTISHELLEMLGNPFINLLAFDSNASMIHQAFMHEMCDPCEDDSLGYLINGVKVSDFVTPEWFEPAPPTGASFSFNKTLSSPLSLAVGGYMSVYDADKKRWLQKTANRQHPDTMQALHTVATPGSRKHRIAHRHSVWRASKRLAAKH